MVYQHRRLEPEPDTEPDSKKPRSLARELPLLIIFAFVLALILKTFVVQAFFIPSKSMVPTLKPGDRIKGAGRRANGEGCRRRA